MSSHEPDLESYSEENFKLIKKMEDLPFNEAFGQLMYQNLCRREVTLAAAEPLRIPARLMKTQFPEQITGLFLENEPSFEKLRAALITSYDKTSEYALTFTVGGREFRLETSGDDAFCTVQGYDGPLAYTLPRNILKALLAALVYASQYDPGQPEGSISLAEDGILDREPQDDGGEIEVLLRTLGDLTGEFRCQTSALFTTDQGVVEADVTECQSPSMNMIDSSLSHSEVITATDTLTTTLSQNKVVVGKSDVVIRFAKQVDDSIPNHFEPIDPFEDYEKWLEVCRLFYRSIEPELTQIEAGLETY